MTGWVALFVAVGVLLVALAVPLARRRVRPNAWYGLRVSATFADEWVWYEGNARSARDLLFLGSGQIVLSLVLAAAGIGERAYVLVNVAALLAGTIACCIVGIRRANRLLAQRRAGDGGAAFAPRSA